MKKLLPIVVIVAVVGIGGYVLLNRGTSDTGNTTTEVTSQDTSAPDTFSGTLKDAVELGIAMKCTYKVEGNEYESFIKGENYRGKIKTAEGKTRVIRPPAGNLTIALQFSPAISGVSFVITDIITDGLAGDPHWPD